jgi:uncharacterized protein YutE (UPF0331/DUF86 family)
VTDAELVRKRLAFVASCLADLRRLARVDALETDVRERRFVEHTLQLAIQAALDVASHLVAAKRLEEPRTNRELFERLGEAGLVDPDLARRLGDMAGFRNVLVHGYTEVDLGIVRDVVANRLGDLDAFLKTVRALLPSRG